MRHNFAFLGMHLAINKRMYSSRVYWPLWQLTILQCTRTPCLQGEPRGPQPCELRRIRLTMCSLNARKSLVSRMQGSGDGARYPLPVMLANPPLSPRNYVSRFGREPCDLSK